MTEIPSETASTPALIADIGGTNVRFALAYPDGDVREVRVLKVKAFADPAAAAKAYLKEIDLENPPKRAGFGVASPVAGDRIDLTNHPWTFSIQETQDSLGLDSLQVINDVLALTLAVPHLGEADCAVIGRGQSAAETPIVVVAPGTGLGAGALIFDKGKWTPVATEAGHTSVAAVTPREAEIIGHLKDRFDGHVSYERVVSGPGLVNVYRAICEIDGQPVDMAADPPTVVQRGSEGECSCSTETLRVFAAVLGTFAGNMALTFCARGGVFVGGGVVLKMGRGFDGAIFRRRFEEKGRLGSYLADIPSVLVTHPTPALLGLSQAV